MGSARKSVSDMTSGAACKRNSAKDVRNILPNPWGVTPLCEAIVAYAGVHPHICFSVMSSQLLFLPSITSVGRTMPFRFDLGAPPRKTQAAAPKVKDMAIKKGMFVKKLARNRPRTAAAKRNPYALQTNHHQQASTRTHLLSSPY